MERFHGICKDPNGDGSPLDALMLENIFLVMKVMNMLQKEGTSQIIIHLIPCMFKFHNIKSKI